MLKKKHRLGVAAVLAGAALFSPLLCGMTCMETRVETASAAVEAAPEVGEFAGEFMESGVVGCVLMHVILKIDVSEWMDAVQVGTWVRVGFKAAEMIGGVLEEGLSWM
jgi:hypothetical protein